MISSLARRAYARMLVISTVALLKTTTRTCTNHGGCNSWMDTVTVISVKKPIPGGSGIKRLFINDIGFLYKVKVINYWSKWPQVC